MTFIFSSGMPKILIKSFFVFSETAIIRSADLYSSPGLTSQCQILSRQLKNWGWMAKDKSCAMTIFLSSLLFQKLILGKIKRSIFLPNFFSIILFICGRPLKSREKLKSLLGIRKKIFENL